MATETFKIYGFEDLQKAITELGTRVGGKHLRAAARSAMLPAKRAAQRAAPVGSPPYVYSGASYGGLRAFDPYPRPIYRTKGGGKGPLVAPGFSRRMVAIKAWQSRDKRQVNIMLGVRPEAWQALQFVELGTSRTPARPWLEPSFRSSIKLVDARFKQRLKARLDKAARG